MTDLELTKKCAEAMEIDLIAGSLHPTGAVYYWQRESGDAYDPLNDDAQAMALVKKFDLRIDRNDSENWSVCRDRGSERPPEQGWNPDLNRAIVECVAKAQASGFGRK